MNNNEQKFCQSCGMPLSDEILGTNRRQTESNQARLNCRGAKEEDQLVNADGSKNEDYCIYCYKDGAFTGDFTMEEMVEYCSMFVEEYNKNTGQHLTCCEYKDVLRQFYPTLKRWSGEDQNLPHADHPMKKIYIKEVNALGVKDLHVDNLFVLQGSFINQPYTIEGNEVKLFDDNAFYWGNQVVKEDGRCYGIACCEQFIMVSEYGKDGSDAELVIFKKR